MRKRIPSLMLALAMVLSLGGAALADSLDEDYAEEEQPMQSKRGADDTFFSVLSPA